MPTYPTSPIPVPIYPAGIQGPITIRNSGDTSVSVSSISAPFSGFALSKGGSIEWPANTPLWVYGELGGLISVGGGSGLVGSPVVNVPAPVVNVEAPVVNVTNPVNIYDPATDEDAVRVYTQSQIDALTATDKNTNFVIYNTTTDALNYCVNGAIKVPSSGAKAPISGTFNFPATSLQYNVFQTFTIPIGTGFSRVLGALSSQQGGYPGYQFVAVSSALLAQVAGAYGNTPGTNPLTVTNQVVNITGPGGSGMWMRNLVYNATTGNLTLELAANNANFSIPAGANGIQMNWTAD